MSWLCKKCFELFYGIEETDESNTTVIKKSFDVIENREEFKQILVERSNFQNQEGWSRKFYDRSKYKMTAHNLVVDGWSLENKKSLYFSETFPLNRIKFWAEFEWYHFGVGLVIDDENKSNVYLLSTLEAETIYSYLSTNTNKKTQKQNKPEPCPEINFTKRNTFKSHFAAE